MSTSQHAVVTLPELRSPATIAFAFTRRVRHAGRLRDAGGARVPVKRPEKDPMPSYSYGASRSHFLFLTMSQRFFREPSPLSVP